jgi:RNA polymerase sigma-70 factor (ECF subfamily)
MAERVPPVCAEPAATLGAVLYARKGARLVDEGEWVALVREVAHGDQRALFGLYERARRPVFTLAMRLTSARETAEEVTLDVFHDVWRRAGAYDPGNGTVLGWIMNQARSRAIDRLRFEHRQKRVDPGMDAGPAGESPDPSELVELRQQGVALQAALGGLNDDERKAIDLAFFKGLTHAEVAAELGAPLGTVKSRIRTGLQKARRAMDERRDA